MNRKKCKDHKGIEYKSKQEMCEAYGIKPTTFNERIRCGHSLEAALSSKLSANDRKVFCKDHLGHVYSSKNDLAKAYGFKSYGQIKDRIYRGWSLEKALTTPMGSFHTNWVACSDHLGNEYKNKTELCEAYGIPVGLFETRSKAGWDIERILTTPVKDVSAKAGRVGERMVCKSNGMGMEIIAYRNAYDIDVRFDDGVEVYHREYNNFKKGTIGRPKGVDAWEYKGSLIGRRNIAKCGMWMEIINVHQNGNIDVRFDDGTVVYDKGSSSFYQGTIGNPNHSLIKKKLAETAKERVGLKKRNNSGFEMELVEYNGVNDISVRFSNGVIVKSRMSQWWEGTVKEPLSIHIGEVYQATNGQKMTITAYHSNTDVDVVFDDGTEVLHKAYYNVRTGQIKNPNNPYISSKVRTKHRLGERHTLNSGEVVEIVEYNKASDVTIKVLSTGYVIRGLKYHRLVRGDIDATDYSSRVGTKVLMNCGLYATCISYENSSKTGTIIKFEDGSVRKCIWNRFVAGEVGHPNLSTRGVKSPFLFFGVLVKKYAYCYNSEANYYCVLPDGTTDIMTLREISERFGG